MGLRAANFVARAMALAIAASPFAAKADELRSPVASRAFLFGGADAGQNYGFVWTGVTAIPFGNLGDDGVRVRAMGGIGQYEYNTSAVASGKNKGTISSGELMIGNRRSFGGAVLTGYVGLDAKNYTLRDPDPGNPETGSHAGIKAALELYARTAPAWFLTASGNISSVFGSYSARAAINNELAPGFALGTEGALLGDERYDEQRAGLIATVTFAKSSITVAGGIAHSSDSGSGVYTTLTVYAPF
jgi:hypothetical protein